MEGSQVGTQRHIVFVAGFLFSVAIALTSYINSSFLELALGGKTYVGLVYAVASLATIIFLLYIEDVLNKIGNRKMAIRTAWALFGSLALMAVGGSSAFIVVPAFIIYFLCINVMIATLDIFVEGFSSKKSIGTARGTYLMVINMAWVASQMMSGSIIERSSYKGIYIFAALFALLSVFVFSFFIKNFKDPMYKKISVWETIKFFLKNQDIRRIYLANLILKFFYAWMVIYTPIYLHEVLGFEWSEIGMIFSIMLLPFVLLPFPLGRLSDQIGEKEMLLIGFVVISAATLTLPFISTPILLLVAAVLFTTRLGAATIEVMSESYFFKVVHEENADAIGFFRNTMSVSYLVAPILALPILLYVPSFKYMFFVLTAILLLGLYFSLRIKDVK